MSDENKSAITQRWWFKLIRFSTVGIFQGIARLVRGFGGLSRKAKLSVAGGFVALVIVAGIVGQQEIKQARELGFASVEEMRDAEKAGFSNKALYDKHLADLAAAEEAEQEKAAKDAANREEAQREQDERERAERGAADSQSDASAQAATTRNSDVVLLDGNTLSQWRRMCRTYSQIKYDCASAASPNSCIDTRLGDLALNRSIYDCDGGEPPYYLLPKN